VRVKGGGADLSQSFLGRQPRSTTAIAPSRSIISVVIRNVNVQTINQLNSIHSNATLRNYSYPAHDVSQYKSTAAHGLCCAMLNHTDTVQWHKSTVSGSSKWKKKHNHWRLQLLKSNQLSIILIHMICCNLETKCEDETTSFIAKFKLHERKTYIHWCPRHRSHGRIATSICEIR